MTTTPFRSRIAFLLVALVTTACLPADGEDQWVTPRTPDGNPDLQGNWSNATMTPIERPSGVGPVLTAEEVAALQDGRSDFIEAEAQDSDPDRGAPAAGGEFTGDPLLDAASGGTGGYNYFWVDGGDQIAIYDGEARSSLIVDPPSGKRPDYSEEGLKRVATRAEFTAQFDSYDNPENRPLAERCLMSFGSNGGPPMLPNYFYNNNYTIVQTPEYVMIMTEMVHDFRIIRMGEPRRLPEHIRPWMGDSWGHWEGDTLVVETTNIHPEQVLAGLSAAQFNPSEAIRVTERFTRADESTINYEFTVEDPLLFAASWSGEVPFNMMPDDDLIYEYACHEGNYALSNVLSGARAAEREGS